MKQKIHSAFKNYFDIEFEIVGESRATKLVELVIENKELEVVIDERGSNMDLIESIKIAFECIIAIKTVYEIIEIRKNLKKDKLKKEILEVLASKELLNNEEIKGSIEELIEDEL